jgi:hypothetical protein
VLETEMEIPDQVIQALTPNCSDDALHQGLLVGRFGARSEGRFRDRQEMQ